MSENFSIDSKFCKCGSKKVKCPYHETNRDPDIWTKRPTEPKYVKECLDKIQEKSKLFNNALDVACILVKIMIICAIQECKAKKAVDSIIYALLHFKTQTSTCSNKVRRIINKEQLYCDLRKIAEMTKCEARLVCAITSSSFKAFYYKQNIDFFDEDYVSLKKWREVACEAIKAYSKYRVSSKYNVRCIAWKINNTIQWYVDNKKNKCFPSDFTTTCLAPCEPTPESPPKPDSIPFVQVCPQGPPLIPDIELQKQKEKINADAERDDEEEKYKEDKVDVIQLSRSNLKQKDDIDNENESKIEDSKIKGSKIKGSPSDVKDITRTNDLDDCLEKLRQLEALNNTLVNDLKRKDDQLENLKNELELIKSNLIETVDKSTSRLTKLSNKSRSFNDFQLTFSTKQNGDDLEIELKNLYPGQNLVHVKKLILIDNDNTHEYKCKNYK